MIIDGKKIAKEIAKELAEKAAARGKKKLAAIVVGSDPASASYTKIKKNVGSEIGVEVEILTFSEDTEQAEVERKITALGVDDSVDGVIVQLPLPRSLDIDKLFKKIPAEKDVDSLSGASQFYAPVALAVEEILKRGGIGMDSKKIVVVGRGRLVGAPVERWFIEKGLQVEVVDEFTIDLSGVMQEADIVISGAGSPHFIKPNMLKKGVVLIDAGTSEESGKLAGDADPLCSDKCVLFTPVPGGVGPITVVKLFENLLDTKHN